jgi:hypothetical protein
MPRSIHGPSRSSALDELAEASPSTFVRTRNALVARLRKAGDTRQAADIAARRRPSLVLWLVNRLAQTKPEAIRDLLDASDDLRRAQLRDPRAVAEATRRHRAALQRLARATDEILAGAGMRRSSEISRRVQATLTAAAAYPRTHSALRRGELTEEIEAGGFDVLGGEPSRHLTLVKSDDRRPAGNKTSAKPEGERKREERAKRQAARREAQAARRQAAKVKAEAARRQRSIDRATRQADRLREQLRAVEARIERERGGGSRT